LKIQASRRHRIISLIHYKTHVTTNPAKISEMLATCLQRICRIPTKTYRMLDENPLQRHSGIMQAIENSTPRYYH
jgi:hypothetical protein